MTAPSRTTPDQPTGPVGARRSVDPARRGPDGAPDLAAGRILAGRYRIDGEIGRGGMATVYRARDQELERDVAIKVLHRRDLTGEQGRRLLREARAVAALNHPHIVTIHDVGLEGEIPFIIMELVDGNNLRQLARAPLGRVVEIACQLCRALEHVHARQMVHRDLKPENVLVTWDGDAPTVKLADLGIALSRAHTRQTEAGTLVGTALYLAPEQALGRPVDARADLYALGVVLYELIAGRPPFEGDDPLTIVSQHLHAPVVAPRAFRPDLPSALESIVVDLLSKDPARRPGSAREVLARFDGLASTSPASGPAAARAPIDRQVDAGDASDTDLPSGDYVALLDELVRGRLVGRSTELAELRDLWRRAGQGHGHIALVSGEPGVGKTRLARELVAQAQFEGAEVLAGGCYEYDATTPYLPFVEALRAWVQRQDDATLAEKVGPIACELVRLAPEIADRLPGIEEPPRLEPHEERLRLFDSVARFLRTLAAERGLLVWLEDLQWADQGTIALLHDILRHLRDARLLVLGTYREVELDRVHPLSRALIDWNRGRLATRIQLGRLSPDGTGAVLATLLGQDSVSGSFVTAIHAETDGNPFFLEETVKALIEQGQIHRHDGEWIACDVQQLTVPQSVRAAIGRRLDRLDASSLEVLHTAAVIGKVFTFDEMRAASPSGEDELLDALDVASAAQLIELLPGESFAFTHDKIREVLYEELNPVRRRRLHRRFAEGLEHQLGQRADEHAQDLAHHYLQGGAIESGMRHAIAAARRAERVYAHDEAIECLARARECAEELEDTEVSRDIEERLAAVHAARGDSDATARHLEQALARCQAPSERLALQARIGEAYASTGDPRGPEYLEEAIAGLDPDRQPLELARATAMMGRFHHYAGDHRRSAELIGRAIELAGPHADAALLGTMYAYRAGAHQHLAELAESDLWARRCIDLGEPITRAIGYEFLAENRLLRARWREALEYAGEDGALGTQIGSLDRVAWSQMCQAYARLGLGELAAAEAAMQEGMALAERIDERRVRLLMEIYLGIVLADQGRLDEADAQARRALEQAEAASLLVYMRLEASRVLGHVHLCARRYAEALEVLETIDRELGATERERVVRLGTAPLHAAALAGLGRWDEAAARARQAIDLGRAAAAAHIEGGGHRVLAQVHAGRGDDEATAAAFDRSIELLERSETRVEHARTLAARGHWRLDRGQAADGRDDFERALALFEACGAALDAERTRAAIAGTDRGRAGDHG